MCYNPRLSSDNGSQINNTDLKAGLTVSWASPIAPSKTDGLTALKTLETELSKVNKKMYKRLKQCRAFEKAANKIKQGPYSAPMLGPTLRSDCSPNQYNGERIDIEIFKGVAFD